MKNLADALIRNCSEFFQQTGKKQGVLGISGGVDSAVVAAISSYALGANNVRGFFLPHRAFSSPENLADAKMVADFFKISAQEIEISPFCAPFFDLNFCRSTMTRGNVMARTRMILLYTAANESDALVLGTGNKTELLTGFFTKWGDGAVDLEVLGQVWKSEVFALAEYFGLPKTLVEKPPTAELFTGHTDEEELKISYAALDAALQKREKEGKNFVAISSEEKRANELFRNSQHKRDAIPSLQRE